MATANVDIAIGLPPPTSIELRVNAIQNLSLGLSGIGKAYLTRTANLSTGLGLISRGGFGEVVGLDLTFGLAGTVGGFIDGIGTVNLTHGLAGSGRVNAPALLTTQFGLAGTPNISGGIVNSAANISMTFGLFAPERIGSFAPIDVQLDLDATGSVHFNTPVTDMRLTFASEEIRLFWRKS